ncbi:NYN domain-containing protein [Pinirhizobacter soli]|uniref:NYN domain-containing protein n=1 Tax=Pinirhizobacter soli TaxID=2786953 RepID=UPI00202A12FE|nr:NYN domain-containing protein [Pinirhizobacter soli]
MRTAVYVDGFNLFHRLLEGRPNIKWLDPTALAKACLRDENQIDLVRYFTARVSAEDSDPDQSSRQDIYLRALESSQVHIHYGTFRRRKKRYALVDPPFGTRDRYATVWHREEKQSDVNLAVNMLHDAWSEHFDCAVLVSNDSDLAEALRLVRSMGKVVGLLCPGQGRPATELAKHANFVRHVDSAHLAKAQFPNPLRARDGRVIHCPPRWLLAEA